MRRPSNFVGRCIYCDSTKNLTREHVIPEGIGGRIAPAGRHEALVLRDATCDGCKNITHAFEGVVQGKMMGYFRAAKGFVHKDRATATRKIKVQRGDGAEELVEVEIGALPAVVMLPVFGQPGLVSGTPIGGSYDMQIAAFADYDPDKLRMEKGVKFSLGGLAPDTFCQMLAKIGLGFAVHHFGIDGFKPLVREFILGKKEDLGGPRNGVIVGMIP